MFANNTGKKNYYEILGIPQNATYEEVKKAYHGLALKYHPDKASLSDISPENAGILFREINSAYDTLSDPSRRIDYDLSLNPETPINNTSFPWADRNYRTAFSQWRNAEGFDFGSTWYRSSSPATSLFWEHEKNIRTAPAATIIQSGNLALLMYLEKNEKLDIFSKYGVESIESVNTRLLEAAARSGNIEMMRYLLEEKGLLAECKKEKNKYFYIAAILKEAIKESGYDTKKVATQERLNMIRYFMEHEFTFSADADALRYLIEENTGFSGIEINAYMQSYLPELEKYRDLLLATSRGLNTLSKVELFHLFSLNIKKGSLGHYKNEIHEQIKKLKITNDELKLLIANNMQFKIDALFYYSNYRCENDLSQLQIIIESGIDINIKNTYGETAVQYAFDQGYRLQYNEIVKFLIEMGADVYKCWPPGKSLVFAGKSLYDFLSPDEEFQEQLERLSIKSANQNDNTQSYTRPKMR